MFSQTDFEHSESRLRYTNVVRSKYGATHAHDLQGHEHKRKTCGVVVRIPMIIAVQSRCSYTTRVRGTVRELLL